MPSEGAQPNIQFRVQNHPSLPTPASAFNSGAVTARSEPRDRPSLAAGLRLSRVRTKAVGYLDVASDEMSQIFSVLSPLPLTPPALRHLWSRLRSLPTGLRYGSAHQA